MGDELPPQPHQQQHDGGAVQQQIKNIQWLDERALTQHAQFFDQVRLRRDRCHGHPGGQRDQNGQRKFVEPGHAVAAFTQAAHRQATPRAASGILFSKSALNCAWVHQQGGCWMPVAACTSMAHWLGWPHRGQFWGLKVGVGVMVNIS